MPGDIRNLEFIRSLTSDSHPAYGQRLFEALQDIIQNQQNVTSQVNGNVAGNPQPPPAVNGIKVSAQNGHFQIAVQDSNEISRGISYHVEHADNPQFTNSQTVHLGPTRNANMFLGNVKRYFRAYSSYGSTAISAPAYHGGAATPEAVEGGGPIGGPSFLSSEGSGTGAAGVGLSGPGPIPFRSTTGKPPIR